MVNHLLIIDDLVFADVPTQSWDRRLACTITTIELGSCFDQSIHTKCTRWSLLPAREEWMSSDQGDAQIRLSSNVSWYFGFANQSARRVCILNSLGRNTLSILHFHCSLSWLGANGSCVNSSTQCRWLQFQPRPLTTLVEFPIWNNSITVITFGST